MDATDMFHVDLVESTPESGSATPGKWCRYVISNRSSRVVGRFRGTLAQTRRNAEQLADSINERALSGRSIWAVSSQAKRKSVRKNSNAANKQ